MVGSQQRSVRRRPVLIADYRKAERTEADAPAKHDRGLRYAFPPAGPVEEGGRSDGYCYRIEFAAGRMAASYALLCAFLKEQGYAAVPVPADVEELRRFRLPPKLRHQLSLFGEDGYVHNPVKILFPRPAGGRGGLILELYNEAEPGHLLKFHRR